MRTNWKTKNWNPNDDPTQDMNSSTESEEEEQVKISEGKDKVAELGSPNDKSIGRDVNAK